MQPREGEEWMQMQYTRKALASKLNIPRDQITPGADGLDTWPGISDHLRVKGPIPARLDPDFLREMRRQYLEEHPEEDQARPMGAEHLQELKDLVSRYLALGRPTATVMNAVRDMAIGDNPPSLDYAVDTLGAAVAALHGATILLVDYMHIGARPDVTVRLNLWEPTAIILGVQADGSDEHIQNAVNQTSPSLFGICTSLAMAENLPEAVRLGTLTHFRSTYIQHELCTYVHEFSRFYDQIRGGGDPQ